MAIQQLNAEMIDLLRAYFQDRNESNFAWKSAVSATLGMPGIIAVWPMSVVRRDAASERARDIAGGGYHLTDNNTPLFGYDNLIPYVEFNGTTQYLSRADFGIAAWADVTGLEAHIVPAQRGLTLGGWFYSDALAGTQTLISKHDGATVAGSSYVLQIEAAGTITGRTYLTPNTASVTSTNSIAALGWFCAILRFDPSATVEVDLNGTNTSAGHALASINDTAAEFNIGAVAGATNYLNGKGSLCFLAQMYYSDAMVSNWFQQTRAMFGV